MFSMDLSGKVAFITGAASGFGKEFTRQLLKCGCKVFAVDIDDNLGLELEQELDNEYGKNVVKFHKCDVTQHQQLKDAFHLAKDTYDGIDIVCNNAGIIGDCHKNLVNGASLDVIKKVLDVNLKAVIEGTYIALDLMAKSKGGNGGIIVNVGSTSGLHVMPQTPIYTASKHGVVSFTRCFKYIENDGVRVNCICPYMVDTPLVRKVNWISFEKFKECLIDIEDVVKAFMQCLSDESLSGDTLAILPKGEIKKYDFAIPTHEL